MNRQTILIVFFVVVLLAFGALWYFYLIGRSGRDAGDASGASTDLYRAYQRIRDLRLNVGFFNDAVFRDLKQEIIPPPATESAGRNNPFLPF